jgi:hypothetical protein
MSKRHSDAIAIQAGACNPSGIAISLLAAIREVMASDGFTGTMQVRTDPAVRLICHQLAYLLNVAALDNDLTEYGNAVAACEANNVVKS